MEMKKWSSKVKRVINEEGRKRINLAIVSANNHYAGFGPGTANSQTFLSSFSDCYAMT
jgi:hypothetical protein